MKNQSAQRAVLWIFFTLIILQPACKDHAESEKYFNQGTAAFQRGDLEEAIKGYTK
jgi:hypothetical protein